MRDSDRTGCPARPCLDLTEPPQARCRTGRGSDAGKGEGLGGSPPRRLTLGTLPGEAIYKRLVCVRMCPVTMGHLAEIDPTREHPCDVVRLRRTIGSGLLEVSASRTETLLGG